MKTSPLSIYTPRHFLFLTPTGSGCILKKKGPDVSNPVSLQPHGEGVNFPKRLCVTPPTQWRGVVPKPELGGLGFGTPPGHEAKLPTPHLKRYKACKFTNYINREFLKDEA
jgi:hypothetical protein